MDLIDIYRTLHPKTAEYTFFSNAYGIFSSIDHMLGHTSLNKFKRIEIISNIFSDHNSMKLEINYRGFLGGTVVKNPPANAGDMVSSPGLRRFHMLWSN